MRIRFTNCIVVASLVTYSSAGVRSQSGGSDTIADLGYGSTTAVAFTLAAENFAGGGQGCWEGPFQCGGGHYDETPGNWGDAQVRPGTDVDLWYDDGGIVIGSLDGSEWVTFPVNVPKSGQYSVAFRTASPLDRPIGSGRINVGIYGVDGSWLENQVVPVTGGPGEWHTYVTWNAPGTIFLPAGAHTLTMWAAGGWYNVRNMQFTLAGAPLEMPSVPGRIEAENYDRDGAPVAYVDLTAGNSGGEYRTDDVDIERVEGSANNYNVGWMSAGEWLQYTIDVGASGSYTLEARVASAGVGGTFHVEADGIPRTGPLSIPDTGGWQQWQTITATVTLEAGVQRLHVVLDTNGSSGAVGNLDYVQLTPEAHVPGGWTSIGPGLAGVPAPIVADPKGTGTLFAGSFGGGVRKSTDSGRTWSSVNTGLTNRAVGALAMDASGPQTVYAGSAENGGVFRSTDGGATWQSVGTAGVVFDLAADPNHPGVVYAGLLAGIRKTSDGGVTWAQVFTGPHPISSITVDPSNSNTLYATTVGGGALRSVDAGQRWSPMSALTPSAVWDLALDPVNSQVLYAATNDEGVWKSTDAGDTWQRVSADDFPVVFSLTIAPSPEHTVYAGTAGGGVWQSVDGGSSWQPTGLAVGTVLSLVMDSAGVLYAGTDVAGAQVSYDLGATWSDLDPGLSGARSFVYGLSIDPANNQKIFVSTNQSGLIASQDGGATWAVAGVGFASFSARQVAFDPSNSQRIYAGSFFAGGLFKSDDGGLSWSRRHFGSAAVYVWALAVDPSSPNIVYAGTNGDGLFKSTDYGDTWTSIGSGLPRPQVQYITLDPSDTRRLFAANVVGVYVSLNGGETWTQVLNKPAWTITIDSNVPSTVYATTRTDGVFRSLDGGSTWQEMNIGLTTPSSRIMGRAAPVIIDPRNPQTLYVGSEADGVFTSHDGAGHWSAVNAGLDNLKLYALVMDPSNPNILYAAGPDGVYKTLTGGEPTAQSINGAQFYMRQH